jgi:hypothetical protein
MLIDRPGRRKMAGLQPWPMIAPFAELAWLSRTSIADEMREEHRRRVLGE